MMSFGDDGRGSETAGDVVVAGLGDRSTRIVVAITGDIDDAPLRPEGRALELVHGEVDGAADRGAPGERSWRLDQPVTEAARSRAVPDQCPLDHDIVHAYRRPFDKTHGNASVRAGCDGL